jgi:ribosomal-protein-alanine N-acetyltransferase
MLELRLNPFCPLSTSRLQLRKLSDADAAALLFLRSDEVVTRYIHQAKDQTEDAVRQLLQRLEGQLQTNESIMWGLSWLNDPTLLGTICLWNVVPAHHQAELGYALHPSCWGQGLMSEAVAEVLRYGFEEMGLHRIEAHVDPDNTASWQLLEKQGFAREGHLRENVHYQGRYFDTLMYSRLAPAASLPREVA